MKYEKTRGLLNQLVADLSQFSVMIHQTHWYMRGADFLTLHPLMDEWMDDINAQLDEVAERLITLDGAPYSTLKEFLQYTKLQEVSGSFDLTIDERMRVLVKGYRYLAELYQTGIELTEEESDPVTQDMLIGFKGATEKRIWMIQAKLNEAPHIDA